MAPLWKLELFKRYGYCCCKCGMTVNLTLHHLFPKSKYPHLKTSMINQVVLCEECHKHYHNHFLNRKIENCNPFTFFEWLGKEVISNNFTHEPKYLVKIDKRYKEGSNRIFKDI